MATKIRLRRMGARNHAFYRLVVADSRSPRDGRFIEVLGHYDPHTDPPTIKVSEERARYWLGVGAQPTDIARAILRKAGVLEASAVPKANSEPSQESAAE